MLKENRSDFLNNKIDKYEYVKRMFDVHKVLYEYADFINKSTISDITIKDDDVYFNFLSNGLQITMVSVSHDMTSVPFTFLNFGSYESEEEKFLFNSVKNDDVVLDIGANIGWYTLNWLKKGKSITVFSFEPIPEIYNKLVKNLILNEQQIKNAFNFGLSNVNGEFDFFLDAEWCGASSMANLRESKSTTNVRYAVKKLDDVFPSLGIDRLDFIKCDVEGAEKLVFEGGIETIKKYTPIIFSEMLRKWSKKFNYHPNDTIRLFTTLGYDCHTIHVNNLQRIECVTDDTLETNFVFLHRNKHAGVLSKWV
ncbi:MAG: FkbM family methyltransferase [Candidatus Omnitrophica bacterium]|nr:FkbM family methyltransferase [Candidatus Omnitrophota bacterium]